MKKIICGIAIAAMCVALYGCGSSISSPGTTPSESSESPSEVVIIDDEINEEPVVEPEVEPEEQVVEITLENFFDYFELRHCESYIERDASGNIISIAPASNTFYYELKDCWEMTDEDASHVIIEFSFGYTVYPVTGLDLQTGEYTLSSEQNTYLRDLILEVLGDPVTVGTASGFDVLFPELVEAACSNDGSYVFCDIDASNPLNYSVFAPVDFNLTLAAGSITITAR